MRVGAVVFREYSIYHEASPPPARSANYKLCSGWGSVKVNEGEFVPELKRKTAFHPEQVRQCYWLVTVYRDESWSGSDLGSSEVITWTLKRCGYTVSGRITCIRDTGSGSNVTRCCITVTIHIANKTVQTRFLIQYSYLQK
jgi:hypothetical protein